MSGQTGIVLSLSSSDNSITIANKSGNYDLKVAGAPTLAVLPSAGAAGIQAAYNTLSTIGGGVIQLLAGTYNVAGTAINPKAGVSLRGAGMGVTVIQQTVLGVRAFDLPGTSNGNYLEFHDFTVNGMWQANQSLGGDFDRCFAIGGISRVLFDNIECTNCRQMSLTAGFSEEITVRNCRIQNSARDCINLSSTKRCIVTGNVIRNSNDDAIAIHQEAADGNPPHEGHIIVGNQIEDANGIKLLGATKCVISNNTLRRVKGYGIYTTPGGVEGYSDQLDVIISNNVITDIINPQLYAGGGAGNIAVGIIVGSATKSFQTPVVPGSPPTTVLPENYYYLSNTSSAQNAGGQGYTITGNVIACFTLPAVAQYSTWGFGQLFYSTGYTNPSMLSGFKFGAQGIRFNGAVLYAKISNNTFIGCNTCISMDVGTVILDQVTISDNTFKRYSQSGVSFETSSVHYGRCLINDNDFDADPYFESANRTQPLDGTWNTAAFLPCAIDIVNYQGFVVRGNSFRNMVRINHFGGTSGSTYMNNTYYMQPDSASSLASSNGSNKGIYAPDGIGPSDLVITEDSNPTSATYARELGRSSPNASSLPTSGYWLAGQFTKNTTFVESGSAASKYTILGWERLTTGNANVLNTDWREMRCLTGN